MCRLLCALPGHLIRKARLDRPHRIKSLRHCFLCGAEEKGVTKDTTLTAIAEVTLQNSLLCQMHECHYPNGETGVGLATTIAVLTVGSGTRLII